MSTSIYVDLPDINQRLTIRGVVYNPDIYNCIKCYVNSNFYGGWDQADSDNAETFMLRTVYVIMNAECPVLWCSKLQTKIALSTIEAGYIALIQVIRKVIAFMELMKELYLIFDIHLPKPEVICAVF